MTPRTRGVLVATLLALSTAALYLPRLDRAPLYLVTDELYSSLTAHSVATTGRDPHGEFLPLYFQMDLPKRGSPMWFQPMLVYAIAGALEILPFSEATIRLPMAVAGVLNVVLMYLVGRLLFSRELFAIAAATLLALTPAHFMYSRFAMDFQAPLPFILGWLLCLLAYLRKPDARILFVAGLLLGIGVYSYIAAAALMPLYALLTCAVLYARRERAARYGVLALGFLIPLALATPALVRHPTLLADVAAHYQPDDAPATAGAAATVGALVGPGRFTDALSLYGRFWNPRFLFVDGPLRFTDATWLVGVFLLPLAGLLIIGAVRALGRPVAPVTMVLMAGLLTAPIPASFAGQGEAIRRALELIPFAVLIGVFGLEVFAAGKENAWRFAGFVVLWTIVLAIGIASHDHVPRAQAFVRASTVPLAIAAFAMVFERVRFERLEPASLLIPAILTIAASQIAYFLGFATMAAVAIAAVFAIALLTGGERSAQERRRVRLVVVLLALVASTLTFYYVDYLVARIGPIPASAIVMALRGSASALVLVGTAAAARFGRRLAERLSGDAVAALTIAAVAYVQVAYFYVDWFADPKLRVVQVATVAIVAVGAAALTRAESPTASRLGLLTAVGVLGLVCLQFAYFYHDYFHQFQSRGSGNAVGNVRLALETAIESADGRPMPAIYIARIRNESPGLATLFAKFYLIKNNRPDLVDHIVEGDEYMGFEVDRVTALPPGSVAIVNPSSRNDRVIDELAAGGAVKKDALLKTPDGTPMFWVLERTTP